MLVVITQTMKQQYVHSSTVHLFRSLVRSQNWDMKIDTLYIIDNINDIIRETAPAAHQLTAGSTCRWRPEDLMTIKMSAMPCGVYQDSTQPELPADYTRSPH